ncbi:MAG: hypothetical protein BMS9Abin20_0200 [Acidimicrobiia bacterium]|nr:MAG: hypothetical protein BMS9Abin20_0200 [Acidimicrobiia bacterium]
MPKGRLSSLFEAPGGYKLFHKVAKSCETTLAPKSPKLQAPQGTSASNRAVFSAPSGGLEPPTPGLGIPSKGSEDEEESPETES